MNTSPLDEKIARYDLLIAGLRESVSLEDRVRVASALYAKAFHMDELGLHEDALPVYDDLLARCGDAPKLELQEFAARAHVSKGVGLARVGRLTEAIALWDRVVREYGDEPGLVLREQVARALGNKGCFLAEAGDHSQALEAYDEVLGRFASAPEDELRGQVLLALGNEASSLRALGQHEDALRLCDRVLADFTALEGRFPKLLADALLMRGNSLCDLGRFVEAVDVFDEIVNRFSASGALPLRQAVVAAMNNAAALFEKLGEPGSAAVEYDNIAQRFADDPDPFIKDLANRARSRRNRLSTI